MALATIEAILEVFPHPNADRLELAKILGYQCVVPKDTYKNGDLIVFIQPDNVLPPDPWADTYRKYAPKRIRAIKLRDEWSEGLILDLDIVKSLLSEDEQAKLQMQPGEDMTKILGITHYEAPESNSTDGPGVKKELPHGIPKTDEERYASLRNIPYGETVDVTLKIDGQSWSAYYHLEKDEFGVTGRKVAFPLDMENFYTAHVKRYDIEEKLKKFCKDEGVSLCLRGESYGEGIQKSKQNPHSKLPKGLAVFSVYMMDKGRHAYRGDEYYFPKVCKALELPMVPMLEQEVPLTKELIRKYAIEETKIDGKPFEGVVMKGKNFSFKVINKSYDSKK